MNKMIICFLATALTVVSGAAYAQAVPQPTETIIVVAPFIVTQEMKANPHQRLMNVSITGTVNFGDLDLGKAADIATLKTRVHDTAESLCKQIELKYPSAGYVPVTNQDCPKAATDEAMDTVNLLASAYKRP